jgi:hypothetical protein
MYFLSTFSGFMIYDIYETGDYILKMMKKTTAKDLCLMYILAKSVLLRSLRFTIKCPKKTVPTCGKNRTFQCHSEPAIQLYVIAYKLAISTSHSLFDMSPQMAICEHKRPGIFFILFNSLILLIC